VRNVELNGEIEIRQPFGTRHGRNRVNEVDRDVRDALVLRGFYSALRIFSGMRAIHPCEVVIVKTLNSDAEAIDTHVLDIADFARSQIFWVGLERYLFYAVGIQLGVHRIHQQADLLGRKRGRCASTKVDGFYLFAFPFRSAQMNFRHHGPSHFSGVFLIGGEMKVAIMASAIAKGNV